MAKRLYGKIKTANGWRNPPNYCYNTKWWRTRREEKLRLNPCCERCEAKGILVNATIVHHRVGLSDVEQTTMDLFKAKSEIKHLESICSPCHNREHLGEYESVETRQYGEFASLVQELGIA